VPKINCKLLTLDSKILDKDLDMIVIPGKEGELGILSGHVPMIVALKKGQIKAYLENTMMTYDIEGGFAHITKDRCNILS
ncbi:ATP synthase epsilon chain, partial [Hyalomma marginatum]